MKRKAIFLSLLLAIGLFSGCSSDDGEVTAIYHLLDENGQETSDFNQGDKIQFELVITNSTNHTIECDDWKQLVNDAFLVYNSEGKIFNPILTEELIYRPIIIKHGEQFCHRLIWPWDAVPLSEGKYHSVCTLAVNGASTKTYTIDFSIR